MPKLVAIIILTFSYFHCEQSACIKPVIFGHRGTTSRAPENTIAAFLYAVDQGADGVEIDVRLTRDEKLIAFHDRRTKRTTDDTETRTVNEMTLDEIKELDAGSWFDEEYAGESIPTLYEIIDELPFDTQIMLDLKVAASFPIVKEFIEEYGAEFNLYERTVAASFNNSILASFKEYFPEIRRAHFIKDMSELSASRRLGAQYVRVPNSKDRDEHEAVREAGFKPIVGNKQLDYEGVVTISNTAEWGAYRKDHRKPEECQ